ncbi:hypothetical protein N9962_00755 [bacterium]|nr:hypothetical protein [bacterium]
MKIKLSDRLVFGSKNQFVLERMGGFAGLAERIGMTFGESSRK